MTVLLVAPLLPAGVVKIDLPPEKGTFKPAPGVELANAQCLTCHSVEYVVVQPPSPKAFWAASVKKMKDKFGAPVPDEQVEALVQYLTHTYGIDTNAAMAATPAPAPKPVAVATTAEGLATQYGCLNCHSVQDKKVGPAYKEVAANYHSDQAAFSKVSEQIHNGGSGKWGPVIMPPFPMINETETRMLAEWILNAK